MVDTVKPVKINIDANNGTKHSVVIVNNDSLTDINIVKNDSTIVIETPTFPDKPEKIMDPFHFQAAEILVPIGFFTATTVIVWMVLRNHQRKSEMRHQERMAAIEKGIVLPAEAVYVESDESEELRKRGKPYNPYKWPLILMMGGAAIIVANIIERDNDWGLGLVLLAIGGALYGAHKMKSRDIGRARTNNHQPPEPPKP